MDAAARQANFVLHTAPRFWNGAISHRESHPELCADFMYMAPPFLAYYAVATNDQTLLKDTIQQSTLYRQILQANTTATYKGLWEHIINQASTSGDHGLWSTGNAWAAAGMTRVFATVQKWEPSTGWTAEQDMLKSYIKEIVDGAMHVEKDGEL